LYIKVLSPNPSGEYGQRPGYLPPIGRGLWASREYDKVVGAVQDAIAKADSP
ncbi:hypothetical protein LCGC14_1364060, partial [marine sediment metagenome]